MMITYYPAQDNMNGRNNAPVVVVSSTPASYRQLRYVFPFLLSATFSPQVAEAILEWSAGFGEYEDQEGDGGQTPSPAELCSTTDAEGKSAVVYAKEHVRGGCVGATCFVYYARHDGSYRKSCGHVGAAKLIFFWGANMT